MRYCTLLSLDLGLTTGYCIQGSKVFFECGVIEWLSPDQFRSQLTQVMLARKPNKFVVEAPVVMRGPLGDKLQEVISATKAVLGPGADWIHPSDWKQDPEVKQEKIPVKGRTTPHERDAFRMGRWWLKTHSEMY